MMLKNSFIVSINKTFEYQEVAPAFKSRNFYLYSALPEDSKTLTIYRGVNYILICFGHLYTYFNKTISTQESLKYIESELESKDLNLALSCIRGGIYNLFIINTETNKCYIQSDEMGISSLFYKVSTHKIEFSNNQFSLKSPDEAPSIITCIEYLKYGYLPYSESMFSTIHKALPGEVFTIDVETLDLSKTDQVWYTYPQSKERIADLNVASKEIYTSFHEYFSLFPEGKYLMGLSGGYDSRLILAFMKHRKPSLFHFLNADPQERNSAETSARVSGLSLTTAKYPLNGPSLFSNILMERFTNISNLEYSHILYLHNLVLENSPDYYLDGFIGDTLLSGTYYIANDNDPFTILRYLSVQDNYETRILDDAVYLSRLYHEKESIPDDFLTNILTEDIKKELRSKVLKIISFLKNYCVTHEDLQESLMHYTRARCLISTGPLGIQFKIPVACPFIDSKVRSVSLKVNKNLRSTDRLYNHFWKVYFPEYAEIPKAKTGGTASQGEIQYRITHLQNSVLKRIRDDFNPLYKKEEYLNLQRYMENEDNKKLINESLKSPSKNIPESIAALAVNKRENIHPKLLMRFVSLNLLLK